ncbi:MAG: c-type cytochrome [Gaiellaceae bacterium]
MSGNDIVLGLVALVLVVFSLVVSLLIPRRDPGFPGRNLRVFVVVAVLLVVAMLAAVEIAGEAHEEEGGGTEATETQEGGDGGDGAAEGDFAAGREVFGAAGCNTCHTLADAGSTAEVGPNLDETLQGQDAAFIRESIVDPDAMVAEGFSPDLMPENYGEQLSDQELADLVAYLVQATGGR